MSHGRTWPAPEKPAATHTRAENAAVSLRSLFPDAVVSGCGDLCVTACSADSRRVQPGELFVALAGTRADGHQYVAEAFARGACGAVIERDCAGAGGPTFRVPDTRVAYARLTQTLEGNPAEKLKAIGITGTNGKTTTTFLVRSVLGAAGYRVGLLGTVECNDGVRWQPSKMTTPDAHELARQLAAMVANGCTHAVMEVSSHALDQRRVDGVEFDTAVLTNLAADHLDYHGTREAYRTAKGRLFQLLSADGRAILNGDDEARQYYAALCARTPVTYAVERPADVMAEVRNVSLQGTKFRLHVAGRSREVQTPLVGLHNVQNCLAAAAVGARYGLAIETIARGIETLPAVPGRLEPVRCGQPFDVIVDYAHTADALTAVLRALRSVVAGRILCVFGAGGDRDRTKRPRMGAAAEAGADVVIVTSDNPRSEDPEKIIGEIVAGLRRPKAARVEPDRRAAIHLALRLAKNGDCVLIAGKGHETYQILRDRTIEFDDRAVAREWLSGCSAPREKAVA